eukprot:TRINITY_DN12375_c0_g1_i1.p1 TRINITY_DN12375_c0_g1~~TRINITY_DN12375_c0_g1_i1.p1  ORF type:complete len:226 (-),score=49.50 TRINITY_DN12375_c0_g1_i1:19-696(-)
MDDIMEVDTPDAPIIDALPYVDLDYTEDDESYAIKLIQSEMRTFKPGDYLQNRSSPSLQLSSDLLFKEFNEIENSASENNNEPQYRLPPLDMSKYESEKPPPHQLKNPSAWEESLSNSKIQLNNYFNQIDNLELMKMYGGNSWKVYNESLAITHNRLEQILSSIKKETESINWQRKQEQTPVGDKLKQLEQTWLETVFKNLEIEKACVQLEQQIESLEKSNNSSV